MSWTLKILVYCKTGVIYDESVYVWDEKKEQLDLKIVGKFRSLYSLCNAGEDGAL